MDNRFDSRNRMVSIRVELAQLATAAQEICERRAALIRELNAQSKILVLPPEVLSLIFQHTVTSHGSFNRTGVFVTPIRSTASFLPLLLGSVSRTWRQVAWSTPQLWATLSLSIPVYQAWNLTLLLDLYFTNVQALPFNLSIQFDYRSNLFHEHDPVGEVFFKKENLKKLGILKLHKLPNSWLYGFGSPLPQLTDFQITGANDDFPMGFPKSIFLVNAPLLRKLYLTQMPPLASAPLSLITTLKLEKTSAAAALRCLLESPNLVEFYFIEITHLHPTASLDEEHEEAPEMPNTLTLHHLEILEWSFKLNNSSDLFLRRIRLPALRSLTWDQRKVSLAGQYYQGIWTFFKNLSCASLTTLRLRWMLADDIPLIQHIYCENPQVEDLILENCGEETIFTALGSLVPGWYNDEEWRYLLKLKTLEVHNCAFDEEEYTDRLEGPFERLMTGLLIDRTNNLKLGESLCVNLVFNEETEIIWSRETKEELREADRNSVRVHLLVDGEQPEWFGGSSLEDSDETEDSTQEE